jgi:hypothetical protein
MAEWIFCLFEIRYRLNFPYNKYLVLNTWIWRLKFCRRYHDEPIFCLFANSIGYERKSRNSKHPRKHGMIAKQIRIFLAYFRLLEITIVQTLTDFLSVCSTDGWLNFLHFYEWKLDQVFFHAFLIKKWRGTRTASENPNEIKGHIYAKYTHSGPNFWIISMNLVIFLKIVDFSRK